MLSGKLAVLITGVHSQTLCMWQTLRCYRSCPEVKTRQPKRSEKASADLRVFVGVFLYRCAESERSG